MSKRDEILEHLKTLKGLPASTVEAFRLLNDPGFDLHELAHAIEFDPGMTVNLLRMANSSYFGLTREISTVQEAIMRLGLRNLFNVLVTSSAAPMFQRSVSGYEIPAGKLWAQAVATAVATDKLAVACDKASPDLAFTTGLLLDIGKLALATFVEVDAEEILDLVELDDLSFDAAEREILGIDHAEVGAILLNRWQLPGDLCEAVRWHHRPELASRDSLVLDLAHLADRLAHVSGIGLGLDAGRYHYAESSFLRLGYSRDQDGQIVGEIQQSLEELDGLFVGQEA